MRRWRLYLALVVLLVLAADVRPQQARQNEGPRYVVFAFADMPGHACGIPAAILFSEPEDAFLERNRQAAAFFGVRPGLDAQKIILHYSCVDEILGNLGAYRRRGAISLGDVR